MAGFKLEVTDSGQTYKALKRNITLNEFDDQIEALNIGLGSGPDNLRFSADLDTVNHVLADGEHTENIVDVPVQCLDDVLVDRIPVVIKIDVEGFETKVVEGATKALAATELLAVIMELNGSGARYGFDEDELHQYILSFGFDTYSYDPSNRKFSSLESGTNRTGNTLYLRDTSEVCARINEVSN